MKLYRTKDRTLNYMIANNTHAYFVDLQDIVNSFKLIKHHGWFIRFATEEDTDILIAEFDSIEDLQSSHPELLI